MGKVLWTEDGDQFDKIHSGCMSGMFHALDYQYWHSVKKILPHRKHETLIKHANRNRRHKRISDDQDPFEVLKLLEAETSHILVDRSNRKTSSTQKRSLKARIKALVSEDTFKDNDKERDPKFVPSPRLQRTNSIHHLESNEWVRPIIFFPDSEELHENATENPNVPNSETKDYGDILEMFKVNKELFVNMLQDGSQVSNMKAKLTKSGSFPTGRRFLRPTKLKDKLNESYTTSKTERRLDSSSNLGFLMTELDKQDGKNSHDDLNNNNVMPIRRISSLNESSNRYSQLLDFSKEATLRPSRSLKLANGSENIPSTQEPNFFRTNRSLPHINNPNQESHDAYFFRSASQNERNPVSFPLCTDKPEDCECLNEVVYRSENFSENEHSTEDIPHLSSVLAPEKVQSEFQIPEGLDSLTNSKGNVEKEIMIVNNNKHLESSMRHYQEDDDFTYVKQILERSGFIKNGFHQTWYSSNQPLDPFVFQEIESQYFHDPELFEEEFNELSHHLLIFDLVDEVLVNFYEKSSAYYPKALSSSCHIRPAPTGPRVLDQVWKRVSRWLDLKPDMNESLDDIVSRDLGSDDGWMNLQLDCECVGLELEDLILDEVLEEVLFECS
ncbi:protein TRM32 [Cynara cardunculus var. scolymus]|uniref:DUF4378 domain-containing protein n=1 Tax=Cynara cardunculus var. scolymus TaxID=59895 RepID=A0A118JW04_CYNCS|nr:protein TRM32 [Cynara cardunculus var. scolymus]XP_024981163.1 protein TRM32 [Cynara cardunculus var. scolymus]KVH94629.1 protein of unknown function DUF4378 [Cynara cardunculus var. scolymus]